MHISNKRKLKQLASNRLSDIELKVIIWNQEQGNKSNDLDFSQI